MLPMLQHRVGPVGGSIRTTIVSTVGMLWIGIGGRLLM